MSSSRRNSLLAAGWMCLGLVLSGSGCESTFAPSERSSAATAAPVRGWQETPTRQNVSTGTVQQVAYQQPLNGPNGMSTIMIRPPGFLDPRRMNSRSRQGNSQTDELTTRSIRETRPSVVITGLNTRDRASGR